MFSTFILSASALLLAATPVYAQDHSTAPTHKAMAQHAVADQNGTWITSGTRAGPVASPTRAQPSNVLLFNGKKYLVDVGDGTSGQLAKAGIQTAAIDGVFISHLHFDHTAGLAGILGLRFQTEASNTLTIYGPPGTKELVDGLFASMVPGATANYGVPGAPPKDPKAGVNVIELRNLDSIDVDGIKISVRNNTHYSFKPGSEMAKRFQSLSYRFDLPGRSIVYTGDTGPSTAVEELAKGVDLLVTEMMDVEGTVALVRRANPNMPEKKAKAMETHLRKHHLLPKDVGEMAARAGVKSVVVTHFIGAEPTNPKHFDYLKTIAKYYDGPAVIANDMEAY